MGSLWARWRVCFVGALAAAAIACGHSSADQSTPTAPSSSPGATINGQVANSTTGLRAAVVGTSLSTQVASDGRFNLTRVPVNNVRLSFTGPGTNAMLSLGDLKDGETISIRVAVSGTSATLQNGSTDDDDNDNDRDDDNADEMEVTGRVDAITRRACPSLTFTIGSRTVQTNGATFFRRVTCELLIVGQVVEVEGRLVSGSVQAEKVQLENAQGVDRRGTVTGLSGGCPSLTFTVGGSGPVFFTNGTTEFKDLACSAIRNGVAVRADGHIQSNGQALAERVRSQ